jgi:hypothetical protein
MAVDFRREWVKNSVTRFFGLDSGEYFEAMLAQNDELEYQLTSFLDDDFLKKDETYRRLLYIYKTSYEKLVDEEIMVPEIGEKQLNDLKSVLSFAFYQKISYLM